MTMNTSFLTGSPHRTGAPHLDRRGRAIRMTPWLAQMGQQQVTLNRVDHARLLWQVAQVQAAEVQRQSDGLTAEWRELVQPLRQREAGLVERQTALTAPVLSPVSAQAAQRLQGAEARAEQADTDLISAEDLLAERLGAAGLNGREDFSLSADNGTQLSLVGGAAERVPLAKVWPATTLAASLLMGPALYELGLRAAWLGLGLPEALDPAGIGLACVIGMAIAWTLKSVMEQLALHAGLRSGAYHALLAQEARATDDPGRLKAFLRRRGYIGMLLLALTAVLFAFIEGNLVASSFAAGDVGARVGGGDNALLHLMSGLIALLPSSVWGMACGQRTARVLIGESLSAQARSEMQRAHRADPDVRAALVAAHRADAAQERLGRAEGHLAQVRAEIAAERQQLEVARQSELQAVQSHLTDVRQRLRVLDAEYSRRLEDVHQRADQSAEAALSAYRKQSGSVGWAMRLLQSGSAGRVSA
jgi:hypothetical protein